MSQAGVERLLDTREAKDYRVGALVSTYNSERFIKSCLEDLTAQTIYQQGELEIVVVDSASPQGEWAVVEAFAADHPHVVAIRSWQRESMYRAWNRAVPLARAELLTNANTDDRRRHDSLQIMADVLRQQPELDLVYADSAVSTVENQPFVDNPQTRIWRCPEYWAPSVLLYYHFGPQPLWRRAVHRKIGYYDEAWRLIGDYDFNLRFAQRCKARHLPQVLGSYLEHESAQSFRDQSMARENRQFWQQHRRRETILALYEIQGVPVSTAAQQAAVLTDLGNRALEFFPPWKYGNAHRHLDFAQQLYALAMALQPGWEVPIRNAAAALRLAGQPKPAAELLAARGLTSPAPRQGEVSICATPVQGPSERKLAGL